MKTGVYGKVLNQSHSTANLLFSHLQSKERPSDHKSLGDHDVIMMRDSRNPPYKIQRLVFLPSLMCFTHTGLYYTTVPTLSLLKQLKSLLYYDTVLTGGIFAEKPDAFTHYTSFSKHSRQLLLVYTLFQRLLWQSSQQAIFLKKINK